MYDIRVLNLIRRTAHFYCILFYIYRLEIQKTDSEAFANVGLGFCDQSDTSNCVVYVDLLKDAILPLPICHPDGSFEWPKSRYILLLMLYPLEMDIYEKYVTCECSDAWSRR